MKWPASVVMVTASVLLAAGLGACSADPHKGYSFGTGFPADVKSVSVPIFKNTSTTPGLETVVTEAVIKEMQRSTGLKVTAQEGADTVLRGAITDVVTKLVLQVLKLADEAVLDVLLPHRVTVPAGRLRVGERG